MLLVSCGFLWVLTVGRVVVQTQRRLCELVVLRRQVADYFAWQEGSPRSESRRARVERPRVHEAARALVQSHRRVEEGERGPLDRKPTILEPFGDVHHERRGDPADAPDPARPARVVIAEPAAGRGVRHHAMRCFGPPELEQLGEDRAVSLVGTAACSRRGRGFPRSAGSVCPGRQRPRRHPAPRTRLAGERCRRPRAPGS